MKKNFRSFSKRAAALCMTALMLFSMSVFSAPVKASGLSDVWDGTIGEPPTYEYFLNGYDLYLYSANALVWFLHQIGNNVTFAGATVYLEADIDLDGRDFGDTVWAYHGDQNGSYAFQGTFEGNGHTISNFTMTSSNHRIALFRSAKGATFKNLNLENVNVADSGNNGKNGFAALVGWGGGSLTFENVRVLSGSVSGNRYVGSLIGECAENSGGTLKMTDCSNNADITADGYRVGGLAGSCLPSVNAVNCQNSGSVNGRSTDVGGIVGWIEDDASVFEGCSNSGAVQGTDSIGGILGYMGNPDLDRPLTLIGNVNSGSVTATAGRAAGMVARIDTDSGDHRFLRNINSGTIYGVSDAGGIVAHNKGFGYWSENCNYGQVTAKDDNAGGICGEVEDDPQTFENCRNEGSVSGKNSVGGVMGWAPYSKQVFSDCVNTGGVISSADSAGGIYGLGSRDGNYVEIANCQNSGNIYGYNYAGGICGRINPEGKVGPNIFENCVNTGRIRSDKSAAGIVALIRSDAAHTFTNLKNYGDILSGTSKGAGGGIVGENLGGGEWTGCENYGIVHFFVNAGGILGVVEDDKNTFTDCHNYADVSAFDSAGGIAASVKKDDFTFTSCSNSGDILAYGRTYYAGGILAHLVEGGNAYFFDCMNTGKVRSDNDAGGIAGHIGGQTYVTRCMNAGDISCYTLDAARKSYGGLVGYTATGGSTGTQGIVDSFNWGSVKGGYVGGLLGYVDSGKANYRIACSYNVGEVTGINKNLAAYVSPFIGYGGTIDSTCYANTGNKGTVKTDNEFIAYAFSIDDSFVKNTEGVAIRGKIFYYPILSALADKLNTKQDVCRHKAGWTAHTDGGLYYTCDACGIRLDSACAAEAVPMEGLPSSGALHDGTIYTVTRDRIVIANKESNGLRVDKDAVVIINIPAGVTLTVIGGTGLEKHPGLAGIYVPEGATLIFVGEGSLTVRGGNGAKGSNGEKGEDAVFLSDGDGGKGGDGSGGGGAGIGGNGGIGGTGGAGGTEGGWEDEKNGENGRRGGSGENCGRVFVTALLNLTVNNGSNGEKGLGGDCGDTATSALGLSNPGGGGGGAGGAGGGYAIGGGGGAGGSGGGGGHLKHMPDYYIHPGIYNDDTPPNGGHAGKGGVGASGTAVKGEDGVTAWPLTAAGGNGGDAGTAEALELGIAADDAKLDEYFDRFVFLNDLNGDSPEIVKIRLFEQMPSVTPPTRDGYTFAGYYTKPNGEGTKYYNADGTSAHEADLNTGELYACWVNTVAFDANGGTGSMDAYTTGNGNANYTLPECGFTAPTCRSFAGWTVKIGESEPFEKQPGDSIKVTANTTVSAIWQDAHSFGAPSWTWTSDCSAAVATFSCGVCEYEETVDGAVTSEYVNDHYVYTATAVFMGKTYTDTRNVSADAAASVTVGETVTGYATLSDALANWTDGSTLTLLSDVTADSVITVSGSKTLDLNGCTLSRSLSSAAANGNVITVASAGSLVIDDSSAGKTGTITGGYNNGTGGAVNNNGTLTINDGNISGNKATNGGAGIFNKGTLTINGGTISGNYVYGTGRNGGGIWTDGTLVITGGAITGNSSRTGNGGGISYNNGVLRISGSPVITGNLAYTGENDLFIWNNNNPNNVITIDNALSSDALIGVRLNTLDGSAFTSGLNGKGNADNFISNDSSYTVRLNENAEVFLNRLYTITVEETENGSVTASEETACAGDGITLTVTPTSGYEVESVLVNDAALDAYVFTMPDEDVRITASFVCPHSSYTLSGWTWDADYGSATAAFVCDVCGDTVTLTDWVPSLVRVSEATPEDNEVIYYTAAVTFGEKVYTGRTENIIVLGTADQAAADVVVALIEAIGEAAYTDESKAKIDEARAAYDALTDVQQELVSNIQTLIDAESAYARFVQEAEAAAALAAINSVIEKIDAIGAVEYTDECKTKIDEARAAYDALDERLQPLVSNLQTLTDAEAAYARLAEKVANDKAAAEAVEEKIAAIGEVEYTDDCKAKIDAARAAYDALTDDQKALVDNADALAAAETKYAELKAAAEAAQPGSDKCKFCGKTHTGFWGSIIKFFHSIFYFFAHLFGKM